MSVVTRLRAELRRIRVSHEHDIFVSCRTSRRAQGLSQRPVQWVLRALSPGVKRLGPECDHFPPSGAKVKTELSCTEMVLRAIFLSSYTFLEEGKSVENCIA